MADKKKNTAKATNTKKASASKKQQEINVNYAEIARWVIGFLAFFVILTFIPAINSGALGNLIVPLIKGLFGPLYYVVPVAVLVLDIFWSKIHSKKGAWTKYVLYALEFIFVSVLVQYFTTLGAESEIGFTDLWETGKVFKSAGIISGSAALLFIKTIGPVASLVLSIIGIFICTVLLCGATPKDVIMSIADFVKNSMEKSREAREAARLEAEEAADLETEPEQKPEPAPKKTSKKKKKADMFVELPDEPEEVPQNDIPFVEDLSETPAPVENSDELLDDPLDETPEIVEETAEVIPEETPAAENNFEEEDDEELCLDPIEDTPYVFPPISLLTADEGVSARPGAADIARTSRKLEEVLASFNVKAKVIDTTYGPTVTRYELQPETGVRVKSIINLSDDIALHLAATNVRIENIPGKAAVGIEIPNKNTSMVRLRGLIDNPAFRDAKSRLFSALGEDVAGNPVYLDIAKMPHLLVAGATGQGKSVCINSLILSLLYRNHPNDVKLILIDPKTVEFSDFKDIPHLLVPVINDPKNAAGTLNWACTEMENRYRLIQEVGARDLAGYNIAVSDDPERPMLPQIVIFIDEFADLMMTAPDDVETSVCRLAQKARAAGMHLVIGTQRPSVDVITGLIKANIPSRIALTTTSQVDSRTILDQTGAEKLLGKGDMLYYPVGAMKPIRVQGAFVDGKSEVQAVTQFIKEAAQAQYDESIMKQIEQEAKLCGMKGKKGAQAEAEPDDGSEKLDPMFMDAVEVALECGTVSTSLLQRRLSLGYARAARIIDKMERRGYIGEFDAATKKRGVLITREQFAELKMNGETKKEEEANA